MTGFRAPLTYLLAIAATLTPAIASAVERPYMVTIRPGSFNAGSLPAETDAAHASREYAEREQPQLAMRIAYRFDIGRTEVTRGQFAAFVKATGWKPDGGCASLVDGPTNTWATDPARTWDHPGFAQTDRHPVVCVDLADAQAYASWLSKETGDLYRLPSGAEWEYAARAGTTGALPWKRPADTCRSANISDASRAKAHNKGAVDPEKFATCDDRWVFTAPVGSFRPNRFGLYDMIGNVWEWTSDCLNPNQIGAPTDGSARTSGDCASHIDRGASWTNSPRFVRMAARHGDLVGARNTVLGFRLVRERR